MYIESEIATKKKKKKNYTKSIINEFWDLN